MTVPSSLPAALFEVYQSGHSIGDIGPIPLESNVSIEEAEDLYHRVRDEDISFSFEVGLAHGISTVAILQAMEDKGKGRHIVVDPFQDRFHNAGLKLVEKAGLMHRMDFRKEFPEDVLPGLDAIDFAFIDGSHLFDLTLMDFALVDKKLKVGGMVGFHDMWMPSLRKMMRFILNNRPYTLVNAKEPELALHKRLFSRLLKAMPFASEWVAQEALKPWGLMGVPAMAFIRKQENDHREWAHFHAF